MKTEEEDTTNIKVAMSDDGTYYIQGLEDASPIFLTRKAAEDFLEDRMWEDNGQKRA